MNQLHFEGVLEKHGRRFFEGFRKRWFVLDGSELTYYKAPEYTEENYLGTIDMSLVRSVNPVKTVNNGFQVVTRTRTYTFSATSPELMTDWVSVLRQAMQLQSFENRRTRNGSKNNETRNTTDPLKRNDSEQDDDDVNGMYESVANTNKPAASKTAKKGTLKKSASTDSSVQKFKKEKLQKSSSFVSNANSPERIDGGPVGFYDFAQQPSNTLATYDTVSLPASSASSNIQEQAATEIVAYEIIGSPSTGSQTGRPSTSGPSTSHPSTGGPSTSHPSTGGPSTSGPSTGGPSTGGPSAGGPSTSGPSTGGPSTSGPSTGGPSTGVGTYQQVVVPTSQNESVPDYEVVGAPMPNIEKPSQADEVDDDLYDTVSDVAVTPNSAVTIASGVGSTSEETRGKTKQELHHKMPDAVEEVLYSKPNRKKAPTPLSIISEGSVGETEQTSPTAELGSDDEIVPLPPPRGALYAIEELKMFFRECADEDEEMKRQRIHSSNSEEVFQESPGSAFEQLKNLLATLEVGQA